MKKFTLPTLNGGNWPVQGLSATLNRWGNGFRRERGLMALVDLGSEGYLAYHMDSRLQIENAVMVDELQELAGWFGYCPRAIAFYDGCGIALKAA